MTKMTLSFTKQDFLNFFLYIPLCFEILHTYATSDPPVLFGVRRGSLIFKNLTF